MFTRLRKNIVRSIMIATVLLSTVASFISFVIISQSHYQSYKTSTNDSIDQKITLSSFTFDSVMRTSQQLSENETFLEALDADEFNPQITPVLNTLKNSSFGILAATVYLPDGQTYSTFNISNVVSYEQFSYYDPVHNFLMSEDKSMLSIRTTHIAQLYNNVRYNDDFGMITYIVKLEHNNEFIGLLFVDINPNYIYQSFFNYSNYTRFSGTTTFIIGENSMPLLSALSDRNYTHYIDEAIENPNTMSSNFRYLVNTHSLYDNHHVVTLTPLRPLYMTLMRNGLMLIALNVIVITLAYFVAKNVERTMVTPLQNLQVKMQQSNQILKKPE